MSEHHHLPVEVDQVQQPYPAQRFQSPACEDSAPHPLHDRWVCRVGAPHRSPLSWRADRRCGHDCLGASGPMSSTVQSSASSIHAHPPTPRDSWAISLRRSTLSRQPPWWAAPKCLRRSRTWLPLPRPRPGEWGVGEIRVGVIVGANCPMAGWTVAEVRCLLAVVLPLPKSQACLPARLDSRAIVQAHRGEAQPLFVGEASSRRRVERRRKHL